MPRFKLQSSSFKLHTSQGGFTLLELLISITILAIIASMAGSSFINWNTANLDNNQRLALQREVDLAIDLINLNLQESTGATIASYNGGTNNQITINLGLTTEVFRSNPISSALERNGTDIIKSYMGARIVINDLAFLSTTTPDGKQRITTTLSLKYTNRVGVDYLMEFRTTTVLRNS